MSWNGRLVKWNHTNWELYWYWYFPLIILQLGAVCFLTFLFLFQTYNASQFQKRSIHAILRNTDRLERHFYAHSPRMVPKGNLLNYLPLQSVTSWVVLSSFPKGLWHWVVLVERKCFTKADESLLSNMSLLTNRIPERWYSVLSHSCVHILPLG